MRFATCLNCIDGRTQLPVLNWIRERYRFEFVDLITEPGIAGSLINNSSAASSIVQKVDISLEKHRSRYIFVAGHHDCAAYNGDDRRHKKDLDLALERIMLLFPAVQAIGLWVNENWEIEETGDYLTPT
ncbi:MAG: carbonic anhydrase [Bacillota bacterium]